MVKGMQGTPQQPDPPKGGIQIPVRNTFDEDGDEARPRPVVEEAEPAVRRRAVTATEIEKYGPTRGCPGCDAKVRGVASRRGHTTRSARPTLRNSCGRMRWTSGSFEGTDQRISEHIATKIERERG